MWASTLLGPYVSDPMHLKLSKSYFCIFVGVITGERRGGNVAGHNGLDEHGGRRVMHADFFTRGGVVGPPEGEGEFGRHIISTHGEEKIWR